MSAYGTKKKGADLGLQATYPAIFSMMTMGDERTFFPSGGDAPMELMVGTHFQSVYHEEKRQDANRSVMNGLQANRSAQRLLLTGHQNYHLPKPVLGQRKFANPMNGVTGFSSARRDGSVDAPFAVVESSMRGGVVSTAEGQEFYKLQLTNRIDQLNRMDALAQGFPVPAGQKYNSYKNEDFGDQSKINFFVYLRALSDSIMENDFSRFSFENMKEMFSMLFKFAPTASVDDFEDIVDAWDEMLTSVRQSLAPNAEAQEEAGAKFQEYVETLQIYLEKGKDYVDQMFANVNRSPKDKETLSRSLIKSLGFASFQRKKRDVDVVREEASVDSRVRDSMENFDGSWGGDGDDDDGGGDGRFDRPAGTREDEEADGQARQPYAGRGDDPNRRAFGDRNGLFVYGGPAEWFNEGVEEAASEESRVVAPLDEAGDDVAPPLPIPEKSLATLKLAVERELNEQLLQLGWTKGQRVEDFIETALGGDTEAVTGAMEQSLLNKGFSKAQIAKGMELTEYPLFEEYVGANSGSLEPESASRGVRVGPRAVVDPYAGLADRLLGRPTPKMTPLALGPPAQSGKTLGELGLPKTRADMYSKSDSIASLRAIGAKIPAEYGGPYRPREGSKRKNVVARLIQFLRSIDPSF